MKSKWLALSGISGVTVALLVCLVAAYGKNVNSPTPFIALSGVPVPEIPAVSGEFAGWGSTGGPQSDRTGGAAGSGGNCQARCAPVCGQRHLQRKSRSRGNGGCNGYRTSAGGHWAVYDGGAARGARGMENIVYSACKTAPSSCATVAVAASKQAPAANELILAEVGRAYTEHGALYREGGT